MGPPSHSRPSLLLETANPHTCSDRAGMIENKVTSLPQHHGASIVNSILPFQCQRFDETALEKGNQTPSTRASCIYGSTRARAYPGGSFQQRRHMQDQIQYGQLKSDSRHRVLLRLFLSPSEKLFYCPTLALVEVKNFTGVGDETRNSRSRGSVRGCKVNPGVLPFGALLRQGMERARVRGEGARVVSHLYCQGLNKM